MRRSRPQPATKIEKKNAFFSSSGAKRRGGERGEGRTQEPDFGWWGRRRQEGDIIIY